FSRDFKTDSTAVIANETAIKFMGLKNPVGTTITWGVGKDARRLTIIGVIKDMLMESPFDPVKQTIYFLDYNNVNWMVLKLNPNAGAPASIAKVEATFKKSIPAAPFDYTFADSEFAVKFAAEQRIGKLSTFFAALAIFISCLGLFGLASFVAEQRTKEIGVRKIVGATIFNIWNLLSKEFIALVMISLLIASPVAYYLMNSWIQKYTYHTEISA